MTEPAISIRNLSKCYKLGTIGRHTLVDEAQYWWHKLRGRDPREHLGRIGHNATEKRRVDAEQEGNQEFWALKDVSFDVQPGEVIGIIGRNGAGKSTLLKILSRITEPTEGEALVCGRVGSLLEVGTGFHPELTGRENIYMNGTILGMKKAEIDGKLDEIIAFSELDKFMDTPVKRYSSGMYVRLAFAVAAHLEPEILLVDEVLAVGDANFQKKCMSKMGDAGHDGRTVMFVSHNMPAVTRLCSKAILIEDGGIVDSGPSEQIVANYLRRVSGTESACQWDPTTAPGTDEVRLLGVQVVKKDGTNVAMAGIDDELAVKLTYRVGAANTSFRCLVSFCTQGVIAFAAIEPTEAPRKRAGVYSSTVTIPPHLLAENEYVLNVSIFSSRGAKMHYVKEKGIVAFQVINPQSGSSIHGDYTQGYGGLVRPVLKWEVDSEPVSG